MHPVFLETLKRVLPALSVERFRDRRPFHRWRYDRALGLEELILGASEFITPGVRERMALQQLNTIVTKAFREVPFYRDRASAHGSPAVLRNITDLCRLPILGKQELHARNISHWLTKDFNPARIAHEYTSGTTGVPLLVYSDLKYSTRRRAFFQRVFRWAGIDPAKPMALLKSPRYLGEYRRELFISSLDLRSRRTEYLSTMREFEPVAMRSDPLSLLEFARHFSSAEIRSIGFGAIFSGAQLLTKETRAFLTATFQCPIFDYYACRELGTIASECEEHRGFHVNEEGYYVEIVGDDGAQCSPHEWGRIVISSFVNDVMPLIRYDVGDRGRIFDGPCPCGRTLRRLELDGRQEAILVLPSGRNVHPSAVRHILYRYFTFMKQFQIVQASREEIYVRISPTDSWSAAIGRQIADKLDLLFAREVRVIIDTKSKITANAEGKFQQVVSSVLPPPLAVR